MTDCPARRHLKESLKSSVALGAASHQKVETIMRLMSKQEEVSIGGGQRAIDAQTNSGRRHSLSSLTNSPVIPRDRLSAQRRPTWTALMPSKYVSAAALIPRPTWIVLMPRKYVSADDGGAPQ